MTENCTLKRNANELFKKALFITLSNICLSYVRNAYESISEKWTICVYCK